MSGGNREHPKRTPMDFYLSQCCDKIAHDKPSALKEAKRMSWKYRRVFKAYYCTFCHKWHVGKTRKRFVNKYTSRRHYRDSL